MIQNNNTLTLAVSLVFLKVLQSKSTHLTIMCCPPTKHKIADWQRWCQGHPLLRNSWPASMDRNLLLHSGYILSSYHSKSNKADSLLNEWMDTTHWADSEAMMTVSTSCYGNAGQGAAAYSRWHWVAHDHGRGCCWNTNLVTQFLLSCQGPRIAHVIQKAKWTTEKFLMS